MVSSLGLFLLLEPYSTYELFDFPTVRELAGFVLVGIFGLIPALYVFINQTEDHQRTINNIFEQVPLAVQAVTVGIILLGIDYTLFALRGIITLTTAAEAHQAIISLIFSGLLVLLYYDQHQTQRQQAAVMRRQIDVDETTAEWRRKQQAPQITVQSWQLFDLDGELAKLESHLKELSELTVPFDGENSESVAVVSLRNTGSSTAKNVYVDIEPLVRSPSLPRGYHTLFPLLWFRNSELLDIHRDSLESYFNSRTTEIASNDEGEYLASFGTRSFGGFKDGEADTLADAISNLPFDVEEIVLRAAVNYQDVLGNEYEEPIGAFRISADAFEGLGAAFHIENQVGFEGIPIHDRDQTEALFRDRYAEMKQEGPVVEYEYDFESYPS